MIAFFTLSAVLVLTSASLDLLAPREWMQARHARRAVAVLSNSNDVHGVIDFEYQHEKKTVKITGNITGLAPNSKSHNYAIHFSSRRLRP